jgi:mono/diheme cytochrome c family protein
VQALREKIGLISMPGKARHRRVVAWRVPPVKPPMTRLSRWIGMAALVACAATSVAAPVPAPQRLASPKPDAGGGLYMTRAADCMPCHTRPGGTPFAGGREVSTPYGVLVSPNITPDPSTGIGRWSEDQFFASMHDGIGRAGEYLYPVMPFPSYTKMTRADVLAVRRYLFSLKPVFSPRAPSAMKFPFDLRETLLAWRLLYFRPGTLQPNPQRSAAWNRGAYLVEGAGHCGACHSPRNRLGATEAAASLSGGVVDQWLAPNISSDKLAGIGRLTVGAIVQFLGTGANASEGVAFGPMESVVHDSLQYLTAADLPAIAIYLKAGPDRPGPSLKATATQADITRGTGVYLASCAPCHQDKGQGIPGAIPALSGNRVVETFDPHDMLVVILAGLPGKGGYGAMPGFGGALNDQTVADIANYIRVGFGGQYAPDVSPAMVGRLRDIANIGPGGTKTARAFDCPAIGAAAVPQALATPQDVMALETGGDASMSEKVGRLIDDIRKQQTGLSDAAVTNVVIAAFCPIVANNPALNDNQRRARLIYFNMRLQDQLAARTPDADSGIRTTLELAPKVMQQITRAAADQHQTPADWMAVTLAHQFAAPANP